MVVADAGRDRERVTEQLRFLNVVCIGMVAAVIAYAVVAWFVASGDGAIAGPELPDGFGWVGVAVALSLLAAAPIVQRKTMEGATRRQRPEEGMLASLEHFRLGTLMAFMLREGAAIVGLMLALLTGNPNWCYGLAAVTMVAMIWGWPRREDLEAMLAGQAPA